MTMYTVKTTFGETVTVGETEYLNLLKANLVDLGVVPTPHVDSWDEIIAREVGNQASATSAALAASPALKAAYVPRWKATTAYTSGDIVLNPSGQLVQANSSFTSGSSYSSSNWTVLSGGGGGVAALTVASPVTASGALVAAKHNPVDASLGVLTMTLPTGQVAGTMLSVEKTDSGSNAVTLSGSIRGVGAQTISLVWRNEGLLLVADAAGSWWPVADRKTHAALDAAYANVLGSAENPVTDPAATRPTGLTKVFWQTTTQPTNWVNGDSWVDVS